MITCYVAGSFSADSAWQIELNIRRAEVVALEVWRRGFLALCPHTMCRFYDGAASYQVWIDGTKEMLRRCDVMLLVEGYETSPGSRGEIKEAERLGIPYFDNIDALVAWGKQVKQPLPVEEAANMHRAEICSAEAANVSADAEYDGSDYG